MNSSGPAQILKWVLAQNGQTIKAFEALGRRLERLFGACERREEGESMRRATAKGRWRGNFIEVSASLFRVLCGLGVLGERACGVVALGCEEDRGGSGGMVLRPNLSGLECEGVRRGVSGERGKDEGGVKLPCVFAGEEVEAVAEFRVGSRH